MLHSDDKTRTDDEQLVEFHAREDVLRAGLTKDAKIVEVGPSYAPLTPRRDGWNSFSIDHGTREELVEKYKIHPDKDTSKIEEVDFVWRGGSIADAVPAEHHGTFDAFVAIHVIEHTTDIVSFLQSARKLLRPDGVVVLAVPDKRKCFDFYRHPSTTADALEAYFEGRDRHNIRTLLDYALNMGAKGGAPAWHQDDNRPVDLLVQLVAGVTSVRAHNSSAYYDAHNWVFVPSSFKLLILDLSALGYIDLKVEKITIRPDTEFLVRLVSDVDTLSDEDVHARRRALMNDVLIEIAEQTRQIDGSPLFQPQVQPAPLTSPAPLPSRKRRWFGFGPFS